MLWEQRSAAIPTLVGGGRGKRARASTLVWQARGRETMAEVPAVGTAAGLSAQASERDLA